MILYEDDSIIVCHKEAGIPVQSARLTQKDMVSILNNHLADQGAEPVRVVHRLDQPVEGVIVFARTQRAAAHLSRQIAEGRMKKKYQAVCCITEKARGRFSLQPGEEYRLTDYLKKDPRTNTSVATRKNDRGAKRAELVFRVLAVEDASFAEEPKYLLAEIDLGTGRHHQIRVQMANAGLPLYGDRKYNPQWQDFCQTEYSGSAEHRTGKKNGGGAKTGGYGSGSDSLALCAVSLAFCHPATGETVKYEVKPTAEIFRNLHKVSLTE